MGLAGVLRGGQIRVRARTALRRQLQHLGAERSDHAPTRRHLGGVQRVEVFDEYVVGLAVLLGVLGMADADAEQEPARIGVLDAVVCLGDLVGRRRPHVDDSGGDLQRLGLLQDGLDVVQIALG